jgi:hypothetical protein
VDGKIDRRIGKALRRVDREDSRTRPARLRHGAAVDLAAAHHVEIARKTREPMALKAIGLGGHERARHRARIRARGSGAREGLGDACLELRERKGALAHPLPFSSTA